MGLQPTHTLSASEMRYYKRMSQSLKKIFRLIFCTFSLNKRCSIESFLKMMLLLITNIIAYHILSRNE